MKILEFFKLLTNKMELKFSKKIFFWFKGLRSFPQLIVKVMAVL